MREIKFRVWDKTLKKFVNFDSLPHIDFSSDLYNFGQFTGLKDKNNREIYEGDILQLEGLEYTKNGNYPVIWDYGSFGCITEDDGGLKEFVGLGSLNYKYELVMSFATVVGNIFENPEL